MSERDSDSAQIVDEALPVQAEPVVNAPASRRGMGGLALLLAVAALAVAIYAGWRTFLIERGDDNLETGLVQHLEALEARLTEAERRSARSNELATTLRGQLAENERLHARLREDLLAQGDRAVRMESLLAQLSRERGSSGEQLALNDAGLLLAQAQVRLELFADRSGAIAALALAEQALEQAGGGQGDVRAAVVQARTTLANDPRPSNSALLAELDFVADTLERAPLRVERVSPAALSKLDRGWWQRQFERLDHWLTIRRVDEADPVAVPTKDAVHRALERARMAVLENNHELLPSLLRSARASLLACCEAEAATEAATRLEHLAGLDWTQASPDLRGLRERLERRVEIERPSQTQPMEPVPSGTRPAAVADDETKESAA